MSELNTNFPKAILKKHVKAVDGISRWVDIDTLELAEDRKIVVFGLPGAFTPTCSSQQLPGFENLYHEFRKAGIDDIFCVSVNDTFVMNEWALDQGLVNVKLLPDGSGEFTVKIGMDVRKDNLGFGMRSWRYAAIVDNREIVQTFVEDGFGDDIEGDPYEYSKPDYVLDNVKAFGWNNEGKHIDLEFSDSTDIKEDFS